MITWTVLLKKKTQKSLVKLPEEIRACFALLFREIEFAGPFRTNWPHYGKLRGKCHHCHVKSGNPTYVACWEILDKQSRSVEVYYVGTHENAPY